MKYELRAPTSFTNKVQIFAIFSRTKFIFVLVVCLDCIQIEVLQNLRKHKLEKVWK